jgi:hypothetical protein
MSKKYISDIITNEEISKWKPGERILIRAQTGRGKSHFIKNNIFEHCKNNNMKCLLLSNRSLLKNQNLSDLGEKAEIIVPQNYQLLETRILSGTNTIEELFSEYNIIVYDEIQYAFVDSTYSRHTDLLIGPIKNPMPDKIFIFITATPITLLDYQKDYEHIYTLPTDYTYIENLYFYSSNKTPEIIFQNIGRDEKVIYFSSYASEAYELSTKFESAVFVCSEGNKLSSKSDKVTKTQIENESKFEAKYLCTTRVLDNGINIIDRKVKHIIIDILDPVTLIQCLGRKRVIDENDKVNVYIKYYHKGNIVFTLNQIKAKLGIASIFEELGSIEFQEEYRKKDFDSVIDNDFKINEAKLQNYKTQAKYLEEMLEDEDKEGYKNYICKILHVEKEYIKDADMEFEKSNLRKVLEKWKNRKIFEEDQDQFKDEFFSVVFSPKNPNYRYRGLRSTNAIIEEEKLPYIILSKKESKGDKRNKMYWIVIDLSEDNEALEG